MKKKVINEKLTHLGYCRFETKLQLSNEKWKIFLNNLSYFFNEKYVFKILSTLSNFT